MVENFHCFGGRDRLVINIPGDYHRVRRLLQGQTDNLVKYIFLVFPQVPVDQLQADVQVGKVKKFHRESSLFWISNVIVSSVFSITLISKFFLTLQYR